MKFTERSFDGTRMEDGTHNMRVENPTYDGEKHTISIRAMATSGESEGSYIVDYYNLARKNGEDKIPFGVVKVAALLNATGLEPNRDFADKDEMNAYLGELEAKFQDKAKIPALMDKLEGRVFNGTVKTNAKSGYTNVVKYGPIGNGQPETAQKGEQKKKEW